MLVCRTILRTIFNGLSIQMKLSSTSSESTNQLIKTLNNGGNYNRAFQLFDTLMKQNNVTIKSLLAILDTCTRSGQIERARQIERFINQSNQWKDNLRLQTSLINVYVKCQMVAQAEGIFQRISQSKECDVIVYNTMLKGYLQNHQVERCFQLADQMRSKISPDYVTYILLLNACSMLRDEKRGIAIHNELSNVQHVHLQNAFIDFYGRIHRIEIAEKIFDEMTLRETSTFNSLMKAFLINDLPLKVLQLFERMKSPDEKTIGPIGFKPDLITFMAVCDACEKLGLLNSPESSYGELNWTKIFSTQQSKD